MTSEEVRAIKPQLVRFVGRFRRCFKQERTFGHLKDYAVGLLSDNKRKSIEPIALAAGVGVRTLQQFLADFGWDDRRAQGLLLQVVAEDHPAEESIAVIDSSGHPKRGDQTPGVQRQWCGQLGKQENCVVGQYLLYTDNNAANPFRCMLASDLFLPESWSNDRARCRRAGIPDAVVHRPKWRIAIEQLSWAIGSGIRLDWATFDEEYGTVPQFWFALDRLGVQAIGEAQPRFSVWATLPKWTSGRAEHASKRVDHLARHSPVFTRQKWRRVTIKDTTRGRVVWQVKKAMVRLVAESMHPGPSVPTDRKYWLIVARNEETKEVKYFISNAGPQVSVKKLLKIAFARWHVEKWFEHAKQEAGLGAFEVRTYTSLIRHWLIVRIAMLFLARETQRLRGKKSAGHLRAGGRGGKLGRPPALGRGIDGSGPDRADSLLAVAQ